MRTLHSKTDVRELAKASRERFDQGPEIVFLLQDWSDGYNVGGLFRVADAIGASEVVMTSGTPTPENPMVPVTSLGAHRRVPWKHFADPNEAVEHLVSKGFELIAVELAEGAVAYTDMVWPQRLALVLGNEQRGVYGKMLSRCSGAVFIPMAGKGRSLNVHVAAAIVAFSAKLGSPLPGLE